MASNNPSIAPEAIPVNPPDQQGDAETADLSTEEIDRLMQEERARHGDAEAAFEARNEAENERAAAGKPKTDGPPALPEGMESARTASTATRDREQAGDFESKKGKGKKGKGFKKQKPSAANLRGYARPRLPFSIHGWRKGLKAVGAFFRYNVRAARIEVRQDNEPGRDKWGPTDDRIEARLREEDLPDNFAKVVTRNRAEELVPFTVSKAQWGEWLDGHCDRCKVDPFHEYLKERPPWDGVKRLETLAPRFLGCADTALNRFASAQIPWAAAAYALAGPFEELKLDEAPLFQGPGDIGKSTLFKLLVTLIDPAWFTDGLRLSETSKQWAEKLAGRVIVEVPEMVGATRADVSLIKALLTAENDGADRRAYAKRSESQPRRAALFMTANPHNCLPHDEALWRRFIVVECAVAEGWTPVPLPEIKAYIRDNLDQLWAEAFHYARERGIPFLPDELKPAARAAAEGHGYAPSTVDDTVEALLEDGEIEGLTLEWIYEHAGIKGEHESVHNCRAGRFAKEALLRAGLVPSKKRYPGPGGKVKEHRIWIRTGFELPAGYNPWKVQDKPGTPHAETPCESAVRQLKAAHDARAARAARAARDKEREGGDGSPPPAPPPTPPAEDGPPAVGSDADAVTFMSARP